MIEKMPESYRGTVQTKTDYTKTAPRKWTEEEIGWIVEKKKQGYSNEEIAWSVDRTEISVQIKLKRLSKDDNTYNKPHVIEKYRVNSAFLNDIEPKTILDLYSGEKPYYTGLGKYDVTTNDKNESFPAMFHMDALECLCLLYANKKRYDLIDLDPFGSAYDCFDLAIKMAKKGLAVTFGEYGHKRWKRNDFLKRYYGIEDVEGFNVMDLIREVQRIALRNKKVLVPVYVREWQNIARVWFEIDTVKIIDEPLVDKGLKKVGPEQLKFDL